MHLRIFFLWKLVRKLDFKLLGLGLNGVHIFALIIVQSILDQVTDLLTLSDRHMLVWNEIQSDLPAKKSKAYVLEEFI